jgi:tagatose 6-phosphate kinase
MICAVSLNPAVDKYLRLPHLRHGEHQEATEVITSAGGKGINVGGVVRTLGVDVTLLGFFGGYTGEYLIKEIQREGVSAEPVSIASTTRTAFVIVEDAGPETDIVEPGGAVSNAEVDLLRAKLRSIARKASVVVLTGSVPRGCPDDIYVNLIEDCGGRCPVLLDTGGECLRLAIQSTPETLKPTLVKPNRREAQELFGRKLTGARDFHDALDQLYRAGIKLATISDGEHGLFARNSNGVLHARPPRVKRVNSVGSGDATVAGFAVALARKLPFREALRLATACGTANVLTKECAKVYREDVERLLPEIDIS